MSQPQRPDSRPPDDLDQRSQPGLLSIAPYILIPLLVLALFLAASSPFPRERPREPGRKCRNHLKQIGLALHNYHDREGCFPPAYIADELGRPMHSWRVLILPFLDHQPLYNEYRFDEPWDGPNNRKLADRIVNIYSCPDIRATTTSPEATFTSYVAVMGPNTAWPGTSSTRLSDIKDGPATTLVVVELAGSGIHWMEPRDLHVSQMSPTISPPAGQGASSMHAGGANVLFADGSVRFVSENTPAETIRALLTIQGGEEVPERF